MKKQLKSIRDIIAEAKRRLGDKQLTDTEKKKLASILRAIASELEKSPL